MNPGVNEGGSGSYWEELVIDKLHTQPSATDTYDIKHTKKISSFNTRECQIRPWVAWGKELPNIAPKITRTIKRI